MAFDKNHVAIKKIYSFNTIDPLREYNILKGVKLLSQTEV